MSPSLTPLLHYRVIFLFANYLLILIFILIVVISLGIIGCLASVPSFLLTQQLLRFSDCSKAASRLGGREEAISWVFIVFCFLARTALETAEDLGPDLVCVEPPICVGNDV